MTQRPRLEKGMPFAYLFRTLTASTGQGLEGHVSFKHVACTLRATTCYMCSHILTLIAAFVKS